MCIGYTDKKPTAVTIKYANMAIAREKAKEARKRRYYEANPRDPESKYFLPNLVKGKITVIKKEDMTPEQKQAVVDFERENIEQEGEKC